jgi:hypothetical protein
MTMNNYNFFEMKYKMPKTLSPSDFEHRSLRLDGEKPLMSRIKSLHRQEKNFPVRLCFDAPKLKFTCKEESTGLRMTMNAAALLFEVLQTIKAPCEIELIFIDDLWRLGLKHKAFTLILNGIAQDQA